MVTTTTPTATTTTSATEMLPPPYTPPTNPHLFPTFSEGDEEDEEQEETPSTNITLNAPVTIHGSNNFISFATADFTRMAAMIIATVQKPTAPKGAAGRTVNANINVNCGITVVGERNFVGPPAMRPLGTRLQQLRQHREAQAAAVAGATSAGASGSLKRKAEEVCSMPVLLRSFC